MSSDPLTTQMFPADEPSPWLLVALHGLGDSANGYVWLPTTLGLPWLNCLLVTAPDPYYGGFSWYDFAQNPTSGIGRSRGLLFQLFDQQRAAGFATEKTFVFGFSQGGLMTLELGFRYPHRFAGLISISGYAHEPHQLALQLSPVAREQHFLITHGTQDNLIPFAAVREQVRLFQQIGLQIEWHEFPKEHTISNQELELVRKFLRARAGK